MEENKNRVAALFNNVMDLLLAGDKKEAEDAWLRMGNVVFTSSDYKAKAGIHPHEFGCLRACYYSATATPRKPPPADPKMFVGRALHNEINRTLKAVFGDAYKCDVPTENTEFGKKYGIVGEADGLFFRDGMPFLGLEIKTGYVPTVPFRSHIFQLGLYQLCLKPVTFALWYINREGNKSAVFFLSHEYGHLASVKSRLFDLLMMIEQKKLPPQEGDWVKCRYCAYSYKCPREDSDVESGIY